MTNASGRRGGARVVRGLVITLVVILVLALVADRVGDYIAERVAATKIQKAEQLAIRPDVDVAGFPFLTQLASRSFDEIDVTLRELPLGATSGSGPVLRLTTLRLKFRKVRVSRDFSSANAGSGSASAFVSYADIGRTVGVQVSYAGGGKIKATKSLSLAGRTVPITLTTEPRLVNGAFGFAATSVNGLASLGQAASAALSKLFDVTLPLDGLPFDTRVTGLRVQSDGVRLQLAGADLSYSR